MNILLIQYDLCLLVDENNYIAIKVTIRSIINKDSFLNGC